MEFWPKGTKNKVQPLAAIDLRWPKRPARYLIKGQQVTEHPF